MPLETHTIKQGSTGAGASSHVAQLSSDPRHAALAGQTPVRPSRPNGGGGPSSNEVETENGGIGSPFWASLPQPTNLLFVHRRILELAVVKLSIETVAFQQFLVFALLDDISFVHHQDPIRIADGR
jgi:hypothetical protein